MSAYATIFLSHTVDLPQFRATLSQAHMGHRVVKYLYTGQPQYSIYYITPKKKNSCCKKLEYLIILLPHVELCQTASTIKSYMNMNCINRLVCFCQTSSFYSIRQRLKSLHGYYRTFILQTSFRRKHILRIRPIWKIGKTKPTLWLNQPSPSKCKNYKCRIILYLK